MSEIRYYLLTNGARFDAIFRNNQMNSVSRRNFVTHLHSFKLLRKLNFNWFFRSPRVTPLECCCCNLSGSVGVHGRSQEKEKSQNSTRTSKEDRSRRIKVFWTFAVIHYSVDLSVTQRSVISCYVRYFSGPLKGISFHLPLV